MMENETGWLPKSQPGKYLYLRPTLIANGTSLGVQIPKEALLFIIAVPWPDPFTAPTSTTPSENTTITAKKPTNALKLLASTPDTIRAWPGGFGYAKLGANYGPSLQAHGQAKAIGFDQVLWLFGSERIVTEAGASNFFVVWRNRESGKLELVTPALENQLILPGVTRRSVLELARERLTSGTTGGLEAVEVVERQFGIDEVEKASKEGRIVEAFVSGTAVSFSLFFFCVIVCANEYSTSSLLSRLSGTVMSIWKCLAPVLAVLVTLPRSESG